MLLQNLRDRSIPISVGVIGAGYFGSHTIYQIEEVPGMETSVIADIDREKARTLYRECGIAADSIVEAEFVTDVSTKIEKGHRVITSDASEVVEADIDVVIDATGSPDVAANNAYQALLSGTHVVMVSLEADAVVGPILADVADDVGVTYSLAYGDQPAQIAELCEWAQLVGFEVVAAGTWGRDPDHNGIPDDVFDRYPISSEAVTRFDPDPRLYNSFMDGTKTAIEACSTANVVGLRPDVTGMHLPQAELDKLPNILKPESLGGILTQTGVVEIVRSNDFFSAFVITKAPNEYTRKYLTDRDFITTSDDGTHQLFHRPFHIAQETTVSIARAAIENEPTGVPQSRLAEVVGAAKRNLSEGESLDGPGGYTAYGLLEDYNQTKKKNHVPFGLLENATMLRPVNRDEIITYSDVELNQDRFCVQLRRLHD